MANAPAWLTARPIAHRGLHDKSALVFENSASAAKAAIANEYAIECDIQLTGDGNAVVFHDDDLARLTGKTGLVEAMSTAELGKLTLGDSADTIPPLSGFLDLLGGSVPLICELKSHFNGDIRLADIAHEISKNYSGPLAFKSFDPDMLRRLRALNSPRPLGFIGENSYDHPEWQVLTPQQKHDFTNLTHFPDTRPDFLSWWVRDLPTAASVLYRNALNLPVMTWTVRTLEQQAHAALHADQMVFEGFVPQ